MCRRICVPESSLTFSVFETITGPGVLGLGFIFRLKPFNPKTPCGMPTLIELPLVVISGAPGELSACGAADALIVTGAWVVMADRLAEPTPAPPWPLPLEEAALLRPV